MPLKKMTTFDGIIAWVQKDWAQVSTPWKKVMPCRSIGLVTKAGLLTCTTWMKNAWSDGIEIGRTVSIYGYRKGNGKVNFRTATPGEFMRERKVLTFHDVTFRNGYYFVRSETPYVRGSISDHVSSESIQASKIELVVEASPRPSAFDPEGNPCRWYLDDQSDPHIIKKAWEEDAANQAAYIARVRDELTRFISFQEVEALAEAFSVRPLTRNELHDIVMPSTYDRECLEFLFQEAQDSLYSATSALVETKNGIMVWEDFQEAKKTLAFGNQDIRSLAEKLTEPKIRSSIRAGRTKTGFIGGANHSPKWKHNMVKIIG